jgi:tol-pal system protein YbgF
VKREALKHSTGRDARSAFGVMLATATAALLSGCLAQQADVVEMERTLNSKIAKLDQRDKELQASKEAIDRLVRETRARMGQEMTVLRDEDLPSIRGALDKEAHQVVSLRARLDDLEDRTAKAAASLAAVEQERKAEREHLQQELSKLSTRLDAMPNTIGAMVKTLGTRLDEQDKTIRGGETRNATVAQQLETQGRTVSEQVVQLSRALTDFRQALQGLSDKMAQEEQAAVQLSKRLDTVQARVEADAKATATHMAELNKSVTSVAKAVEGIGSRLASRLDEQDRQLEQTIGAIQAVTTQTNTLTQAVNQLQGARETSKGSSTDRTRKRSSTDAETPLREAVPQAPRQTPPRQSALPAETSVATVAAGKDSSVSAKAAYDESLKKYREGDLDGAQQGFAEFLTMHSSSELAGNAQYWLGECYFAKKDYDRAIDAFDRVKRDYPNSTKVPAALLMKGSVYLALKDHKRASTVLHQVMDAYPQSAEAEKAAEKLAQLRLR